MQMLKPVTNPPKGFTGVMAHKLKHLEGSVAFTVGSMSRSA